MVGVGPGVGADVIRQRRKRADKLKKEQQVVVIHWVQMKFRDVLISVISNTMPKSFDNT